MEVVRKEYHLKEETQETNTVKITNENITRKAIDITIKERDINIERKNTTVRKNQIKVITGDGAENAVANMNPIMNAMHRSIRKINSKKEEQRDEYTQ